MWVDPFVWKKRTFRSYLLVTSLDPLMVFSSVVCFCISEFMPLKALPPWIILLCDSKSHHFEWNWRFGDLSCVSQLVLSFGNKEPSILVLLCKFKQSVCTNIPENWPSGRRINVTKCGHFSLSIQMPPQRYWRSLFLLQHKGFYFKKNDSIVKPFLSIVLQHEATVEWISNPPSCIL